MIKNCVKKLSLVIGVVYSVHIFSYGEAAAVKEVGYFTKPYIFCNSEHSNLLFVLPYKIEKVKKGTRSLSKTSKSHLKSLTQFFLALSSDYIASARFKMTLVAWQSTCIAPFSTSTILQKSFNFNICSLLAAFKQRKFLYTPPEPDGDHKETLHQALCNQETGLAIKAVLIEMLHHLAKEIPVALLIADEHNAQQACIYLTHFMRPSSTSITHPHNSEYTASSMVIIGLIQSLFHDLGYTECINLQCFSELYTNDTDEVCTAPALEVCKDCRFFWHCSDSRCKGYTSHIKVCPKFATDKKENDYFKTTSVSITSSASSNQLGVHREEPTYGLQKSTLYSHCASNSTRHINVIKTPQTYCSTCKKPTDKRCGKCKIMFYCSVECQKKDRKTHRVKCVLRGENKPLHPKKGSLCDRTGCQTITPTPAFHCPGCKIPKYCSQGCQQLDLDSHTQICIKRQCTVCKKQLKKILQCQTCKSTWYCSKECQKTDWKEGHKQTCKPPLFPYHKLDID